MTPFTSMEDHRCPQCNVPLVRAGAICVGCDEGRHYASPHRTSPMMRFDEPSPVAGALELDLDGTEERPAAASDDLDDLVGTHASTFF